MYLRLRNGEVCTYTKSLGFYKVKSKTFGDEVIIPNDKKMNASKQISQYDIVELLTRDTHPAYYL